MYNKFVLCLFVICARKLCGGEECCSRNARIAGGEITEQNSRPYQVALYSRVGTTGELGFCGGSLVHPDWVLTAAHCCFHDGVEVNHVQAILGAHSLYDRYENGRRIVNVGEIVVHPGYEPATFTSDLALMRLANSMQLTETINTVRLPYLNISANNFAGQGATVSGWGIAAQGVTFVSPTLRQKLMTVITDPLCNVTYFNQLPANAVCAFYGTAGTCKGDNGGPMTIFHNATEEVILIGVTSFVSANGCNDDMPSVFTRVQRYLNWISEVALYSRVGTTGELGFCGGSLVHPDWVLTAAHCCFHDGVEVNHVQAILGAHSLYDRYENGRRIVNVGEIVVHPGYEPATFTSDLALMRLANSMQLTETINTVRLPYLNISANNFAGQGATVSGWGIAAQGVTFVSPTLRQKLMTVITDPLCNVTYFNQLPANAVCAFYGTAGTCKGDNGGPMTIFHNATEEVILIGVTSFVSANGCNDDMPSVFTRVQRYLNWISEVTGIQLE